MNILIFCITDFFYNELLEFHPSPLRKFGCIFVPRRLSDCRMSVKSRMWDARLVVDGEVSYAFNDGAVATMDIHGQDALRTVHFHDVPKLVT